MFTEPNIIKYGLVIYLDEVNIPPNLIVHFGSIKYANNPSSVQLLTPAIDIFTWSIMANMVLSTVGQPEIFNKIKTLRTFCLWYSY